MIHSRQVPPADGPAPLVGYDLLFTPGPRLGWVFRDRRELATPYPEPEPSPQAIQARAVARAAAVEQAWRRAWKWAGKPTIVLALVLMLLGGCAASVSGDFNLGLTLITVVILCGPGFGYTGWQWLRREQLREVPPEEEYRQAVADWDERATRHENAELARLGPRPEWGSANNPARRTDVFGGTFAGWQALLMVHGASLLAQCPLLAIDLTGQHAVGQLTTATQRMGIPAITYWLPRDLGRCGLLAEIPSGQLAGTIAEALHAGIPGGARTDRVVDTRVLQQLANALGGRGVTPQRLAAAVRAALGHMIPGGILSSDEQALLTGDLFPPGYREQIGASLVRLDAVMAELAAHSSDGWPARPARYTCLAMGSVPRSAATEVLVALIAQWLTAQVSAAANAPAVLIAGADEVAQPHLERLADACESRGVPVTFLFRHLRADAVGLLGGGTAAFMRLGNHAEAEQAAAYIGRRHTYVVSSLTATRGGNQTSTYGGGDSYGTGDSYSDARTRGWQGAGFFGGEAPSRSRARTTGTNTSRNSSTSWSQADGTNWSEAEARQRVYEYAVEPTALQNLPEYALLMADRSGNALKLRTIECDPAITTLPGASAEPFQPQSASSGDMPSTFGNSVGPMISSSGQGHTGWSASANPELEPALPDEQPQTPWWQRNQPPDHRL